ncbi:MAG: thiamine pyrophosphate-binding protein, partial [Gammaproteobacteria bacterium]|nr:thiamine pyrophosphate-binding protein [Gammaproteobacteria bacterium]
MSSKRQSDGLNRREFIAGATGAGLAATSLTKPEQTQAQEPGEALVAAAPPNADAMAMEGDIPAGYSSAEAGEYFVKRPGSDFMVDVIKSLNLEYITTNPGSSFRGIHESIVNYGGNSQPELLT